jgi:hypothetical protein
MKLEGMAQMYQGARNTLAGVAAAAMLGGCGVNMYTIKPYDHNVAQWKGLPTVQKQDRALAQRLVRFNDAGPASRELNAACEQDKYAKMCDSLLKNGYAELTVDGFKVVGYVAAGYVAGKALGVIKSGGATRPCTPTFVPGQGVVCL